MALLNDDLFAVYRTSDTQTYKLPAGSLQTKLPDGDNDNFILIWNGSTWIPGSIPTLPDGTEDGQVLEWNGTSWSAATIDGGEY